MRKFIIKAGLIGLLPFIILFIGYLVVPVNKNHNIRMYNYKSNLLDSIPSPRIIFIGGSNIRMSLDSGTIKDSLNLNIINYGLTAPVGLKFMIDDISLYAKKRDILVFAPEWHHFYNLAYGSNEALSLILRTAGYDKIHLLNYRQFLSVIKGIPVYLSQNLWLYLRNKSSDMKLNKFGDEIDHWNKENNYKSNPKPITDKFDEDFSLYFINKLNEIENKCTVLIIPPSCCNIAMKKWDRQVNEVENYLKENGHPFIIDPDSSSFSEKYMYDSDYHLNKKGVDIRTSLVIDALKKVLNKEMENK